MQCHALGGLHSRCAISAPGSPTSASARQAFADGLFPTGTSARDFVRLGASSEQRVRSPWRAESLLQLCMRCGMCDSGHIAYRTALWRGFCRSIPGSVACRPEASAANYVVQATETTDGWTDAETLLLLEAVALYGEKWQAVGAYVGSKNQLQCVTRFLTLPVHEALVDALERPDLRPTRVLPPSNAASRSRYGAGSFVTRVPCRCYHRLPNITTFRAGSRSSHSTDLDTLRRSHGVAALQVRRLRRWRVLSRSRTRAIQSWHSWRSSPPCSARG